jgi:hypothetical protein
MSKPTAPKFGMMKWGEEVVALQSFPLPVIYFDNTPCISHLNGIIGVTLTVTGGVPTETAGVDTVAAVVAHLKCNVPAAVALRDAIDKALLLAKPVENPAGKAN